MSITKAKVIIIMTESRGTISYLPNHMDLVYTLPPDFHSLYVGDYDSAIDL